MNERMDTMAATSKAPGALNYAEPAKFESIDDMKPMRSSFGIKGIKLCQEGVVNTVMDGRDVVCAIPTGAGKPLTYRLSRVTSSRMCIANSPLVSFVMDQDMHWRDDRIEAGMLTSVIGKEEARSIIQR
ncbi:hypothetical protein OPQ81_011040 [Rhizoctonia solani]|nr:hypothetical protein OPQ81_011040 [Rhizoctonia solani]